MASLMAKALALESLMALALESLMALALESLMATGSELRPEWESVSPCRKRPW